MKTYEGREVVDVLDRIHYARKKWECRICGRIIQKGGGYRWIYLKGRDTAVKACIKCSNPILQEKVAKTWAELTGKPIEEVKKELYFLEAA